MPTPGTIGMRGKGECSITTCGSCELLPVRVPSFCLTTKRRLNIVFRGTSGEVENFVRVHGGPSVSIALRRRFLLRPVLGFIQSIVASSLKEALFSVMDLLLVIERSLQVGIGVVVAGVGVYALYETWGVRSSSGHPRVRGLTNDSGELCFFNAVVQGLSVCTPLLDFLESMPSTGQSPVQCALHSLLTLLHEEGQPTTIKPLITALEYAMGRKLASGQQDAHELFQFLLDQVHTEAQRPAQSPVATAVLGAVGESTPNRGRAFGRLPHLFDGSMRPYPFNLEVVSTVTCTVCGTSSGFNLCSFVDLSLSLANPEQPRDTLVNCLNLFLAREQVADYYCEQCTVQHCLSLLHKQGVSQAQEAACLACQCAGMELMLKGPGKKLHHSQEKIICSSSCDPNSVALSVSELLKAHKQRTTCWKQLRVAKLPNVLCILLNRSVGEPLYRRLGRES